MATATETDRVSETPRSGPPRTLLMNILFTAAIFTSALLLFAVQPMVSKLLLPPYGGVASVWTTSLLFFQTVLLIGYAYAHYAPRLLGRAQPAVHVVLVLLPLLVLPIALPSWSVPGEGVPTALWLLLVLGAMIGLPFFVLSTTGPLIQEWYSRLGLPRSQDPYFLYAASNIGSLGALIAYPFVVEPTLGTGGQTVGWAAGYALFAVLIIGCVMVLRRRVAQASADSVETRRTSGSEESRPAGTDTAAEQQGAPPAAGNPVTWRRRLLWLALAALPSSLMQGATTHMSTDVAPVPLLWVVPLALFLGTYIIAFGVRKHGWVAGNADLVLVLVFPMTLVALDTDLASTPVTIACALVMLTLVALACHGLLAADRPEPSRLTEFFMLTSLGGALGSLFNGVVAPLVFDQVLEYPLAIVAAALLALCTKAPSRLVRLLSEVRAARVGFLLCTVAAVLLALVTESAPLVMAATALGVPALLSVIRRRSITVALFSGLCLTFVVGVAVEEADGRETGRTFFGTYGIHQDEDRRSLTHGTTVHGFQMLDPDERGTPVSYYAESGPIGDVFAAYGEDVSHVGVLGLGTGAVAAYGEEGQQYDFFEIDPEMVRIASDPDRFTYLEDCACEVQTIVGDGRLRVAEQDAGTYDILMLDAFNSDSVPTHLLTREALEEFSDRLAPGGIIVMNISNRNLDLAPMVGATAPEANLSGLLRRFDNTAPDGEKRDPIASSSSYVVLAKDDATLARLMEDGAPNGAEWSPLPEDGPVWTDSYSSLLPLISW